MSIHSGNLGQGSSRVQTGLSVGPGVTLSLLCPSHDSVHPPAIFMIMEYSGYYILPKLLSKYA